MGHADLAILDPDFALPDAYPHRPGHDSRPALSSQWPGGQCRKRHRGSRLQPGGDPEARPLHEPGGSFRASYAYSNFGFTAGAIAATRPTGKGWEALAEEKVYRPLGMQSTSSRARDFLLQPNRSSLHVRVDGKWDARS